MIDWSLYEFRGIIPRLKGRQLPKSHATLAHDVDLTHGTIKAFREPRKVSDASSDARLYVFGCNIFTFNECVDIAEWIPDCPKLFITGRTDYAETATVNNQGNLVYRRLGVPRPDGVIDVQYKNIDTDKSRSVAYIMTYVNSFGEEGPPSLPSLDISIEDGDSVNLSFNTNPPFEYDIEKIRIYRRESGFRLGSEKESTPNTNWYLVEELSIEEGEYTDSKEMVDLGFPLSTLEVREPPERLKNITAIQETAILSGSVGNKVLFSKNLQSHNFPLSQEITLDDNIVAMESIANSLFVATDGHPYRIEASSGCDSRECRDVVKYDQPMPMIACHTGKGSVATPMGMVYVSADGLVLLSEQSSPIVISTEFFSADDWRQLEPHTMRLEYHKGALFVVSDSISFIMWVDSQSYLDTEHKNLVTFSDVPIDMFETRQGELLFMTKSGVYQWNSGDKLRPYNWVSEPMQTGFLFPITRIRATVLNNKTKISLMCDWGEVSRWHFPGSDIIPYSRLSRHREYFLSATGTGEITELEAGVSNVDMGRT